MKKLLMLVIFISLSLRMYSQWQNIWTSSPLPYETLSGWLNFEKNSEGWNMRFYLLDDVKFSVMTEGLSQTPEYIYYFTDPEKLAGYQLYSLERDLNYDNKADFYVLSYYGTSPYRQSFKILDIVSGNILFEKNDPAYYYSFPLLADVNGDGFIDCVVLRFDYPSFTDYVYEVYSTGTTGFKNEGNPVKFELMQNFPNPFNPSTTIEYSLTNARQVSIIVYDILGNRIKTLVNEIKEAGSHQVVWDGTNDYGIRQSTGTYFYRMNAGDQTLVKKMIILK